MGTALVRAVCQDNRFNLVAALVPPGSIADGRDIGFVAGIGDVGVAGSNHLPACDVVIDFSSPAALTAWLPELQQRRVALVSGTTGLDTEQLAALSQSTDDMPVLSAANMSLGVQLTYLLVEQAAKALGVSADIEVFEAHHRHKKDAPSGTALALGRSAAQARGQSFDDVARLSREGMDCARADGEIGFSTLRAGDVVGEHTVMFGLPGERIEITHRAASRDAFVRGALEAAAWLAGKPAGRYEMSQVLQPEQSR